MGICIMLGQSGCLDVPDVLLRDGDAAFAAGQPDAGRPVKADALPAGGFRVDLVPPSEMAAHRAAWERLSRLALEPNVFHDRPYLEAAGRLKLAGKLRFALVHRTGADKAPGELVGLFPVLSPRRWLPFVTRTWKPVYSSLGTPLVDAACAAGVIGAFLTFAAAAPLSGGLVFAEIATDGAFAAILTAVARRSGHRVETLHDYSRAVLEAAPPRDEREPLNAKKRKELRRLRRRLEDLGRVEFVCATAPADVAAAMEAFLQLEASGWKARGGTALLDDAASAGFARRMTGDLAREGRCRVHLLTLDGRPVAGGIVVEARDRAWFWKTAYDEAYARFSPGLILATEITAAQSARGEITLTDSCAVADHPMIDHVWRGRLRIADIFVSARPAASPLSVLALRLERARRRLRAAAKSLYLNAKGERP